ncbi:hypothetical protein Q8W71_30050 [Methylobacterium sp. NEAU 140]|uniref:hypothetical protein n=1 Tax=Methylobacterium sp. NEAU 140 TaxID=3064945 RepID=UPI002737259A|nr:hypothetical protein [Methylobacterium sp. NEAU 140]MDP4026844.1 hypothetical protein [Methylobacterium sp. NEAU 140]
MTHARIPDFSQPAPIQRTAVEHAPPRQAPADSLYLNLPNEPLPGEGDLWHVVAPVRPDTAHVRAPRFIDLAGELLTAIAIIAGGVLAYGNFPFA